MSEMSGSNWQGQTPCMETLRGHLVTPWEGSLTYVGPPQNVHGRAMGYGPKRTTHRKWNQPRREEFVTDNKAARGKLLSPLTLGVELQDLEFALMNFGLALIWSLLVLVPLLTFSKCNTYSCHCIVDVTWFWLYRDKQLIVCLEFHKRFWTLLCCCWCWSPPLTG